MCTIKCEDRCPAWAELQEKEKVALREALTVGYRFGFGNLNAWVASEWALALEEEGLDLATAINHTSNRTGYHVSTKA